MKIKDCALRVGAKLVRKAYQGDKQVFSWPFDWIHAHGGTVLLDARTDTIDANVTFSRADAAMVCDEQGNWSWQTAPFKQRRSYDVRTKEWGYLFESQRTNLAPNPLAQVVSDGVTITKEAISGPAPGIRFTCKGTVSAGWARIDALASTVKPTGTPFTVSFWSPDSAWTRRKGAGYVSIPPSADRKVVQYDADELCELYFQFGPSGTVVDRVVTIYGCQLETGTVATSPIATNGAAKTVAADVCTYQNNVLSSVDGQSGSILVRGYFPKKEANRPILSGNVNQTTTYWMGYQYGPNPIARGGGGTGPGAELFGTPDNATLLMSYNGTERTLISDTQDEATGSCSASNVTSPLVIGGGSQSGYINHLSVFPAQLPAGARKSIVSNLA